jgi:DNA-directed RNA polymerase subunit M/transcription elongation factor TFIIS
MGKSDVKVREDEMWCPECGAAIKKGFFTCSNCKLKVKMTREINKKQSKKKSPASKKSKKVEPEKVPVESQKKPPEKNPLEKSGHTRYWDF